MAASIATRELKGAAIEANPTSSRRRRLPGRPPKGNGANLHNSFTRGEAAALLRMSRRTVAHAARVLSEDSPAVPAVRLAVEQGRVTVSDASRVMDEPIEVQLRALERVTGGGSRNLAGAAQGLPGGWIAEMTEVIGGAGPTPWRVWRTPARGVSPAGADMGGGAAVVVSGPDAGAGHPGGWLGPSQGWISSSPRQPLRAKSVAQGGRCPGVRPKHLSGRLRATESRSSAFPC